MSDTDPNAGWDFPIEHRDHAFVLHVKGEVLRSIDDPALRAGFLLQLQQELEALIADTDHPHIVASFDDARYINSGILGMMVQVHKWAKAKNGRLNLAGLDPNVSKVVQMMRLDKMLNVYPTVEEAVADFGQS